MYSLPTDGFLEPHWRFKFALIPVVISHNSHEIVHTTHNNFYYASLRPKTPLNYIFCIILGEFLTQGKNNLCRKTLLQATIPLTTVHTTWSLLEIGPLQKAAA